MILSLSLDRSSQNGRNRKITVLSEIQGTNGVSENGRVLPIRQNRGSVESVDSENDSGDFPALLTRLGAGSTAWQVIGGRRAGGVWEVSAR